MASPDSSPPTHARYQVGLWLCGLGLLLLAYDIWFFVFTI